MFSSEHVFVLLQGFPDCALVDVVLYLGRPRILWVCLGRPRILWDMGLFLGRPRILFRDTYGFGQCRFPVSDMILSLSPTCNLELSEKT